MKAKNTNKAEVAPVSGQHTPGRWTAFELGNEDGSWEKWSIVAHGPIAYGGDNTYGALNSEANARLIAAAPELLEALKVCEQALFGGVLSEKNKALKQARAAIAKAEGREQ